MAYIKRKGDIIMKIFKIPVIALKKIMAFIYTFICISTCILSTFTINTCNKDDFRH